MSDDAALAATPSQTAGPFLHVGLNPTPDGLIDAVPQSDRIRLRVKVMDGDGQPVSDALVELWCAGPDVGGPRPAGSAPQAAVARFARMPTDEVGACEFEIGRPGRSSGGGGKPQAPHVNVCLFARGLLRQLHTRIYFAGDQALAEDAVLALVPEDRRGTLIAGPDGEGSGRWVFDVRLHGAQETVFFDV